MIKVNTDAPIHKGYVAVLREGKKKKCYKIAMNSSFPGKKKFD
jgi:hypothetical protein